MSVPMALLVHSHGLTRSVPRDSDDPLLSSEWILRTVPELKGIAALGNQDTSWLR